MPSSAKMLGFLEKVVVWHILLAGLGRANEMEGNPADMAEFEQLLGVK